MSIRYLAIVREREDDMRYRPDAIAALSGLPSPVSVHVFGRLLVAVSGVPSITFDSGIIFGSIFDRRYPRLMREILADEGDQIVQSRGARLIERYWGGYIAMLHQPNGETDVVRAPLGDTPCFTAKIEGGRVYASDLTTLKRVGFETDICWDGITDELAWPFIRFSRTCVTGVEALPGGYRDTIGTYRTRTQIWSPWNHVAAPEEMAAAKHMEQVRRAIQNSVSARASQFPNLQLLLSGGLDSSIVASCLARAETPASLLTLFTRDSAGDERRYARVMAEHLGRPLQESVRDTAVVAPAMSAAANLPWPSARLFEQATAHCTDEAAAASGAHATFTGGGGDNIFFGVRSASLVADQILLQGLTQGALRTAQTLGALSGVGFTPVMFQALRRCLPWRRRSPVQPNLAFLSNEAITLAGKTPPNHDWFTPPGRPLPGKATHVSLLVHAQGFSEHHDPALPIPTIHPLLSQPIVEASLSVPSWLWLMDSKDRGLARHAFASELPAIISERRTKATPESFLAEIIAHHRAECEKLLLEGRLCAQNLLDRNRVEKALRSADYGFHTGAGDLLRLVDVEAWLRAQAD